MPLIELVVIRDYVYVVYTCINIYGFAVEYSTVIIRTVVYTYSRNGPNVPYMQYKMFTFIKLQ